MVASSGHTENGRAMWDAWRAKGLVDKDYKVILEKWASNYFKSPLSTLPDYLESESERPRGVEAGEKMSLVYHVSPEADIYRFRAMRSPKFGEAGMFVTQDVKSIYHSWADYVMIQKHPRGDALRGKDTFKSLTLYTLSIPTRLVKEAEELYKMAAAEAYAHSGNYSLGAFGWDVEIFLPEWMMDSLAIVSRKTLPARSFRERRPVLTDPGDPVYAAPKGPSGQGSLDRLRPLIRSRILSLRGEALTRAKALIKELDHIPVYRETDVFTGKKLSLPVFIAYVAERERELKGILEGGR